MSGYSSFMEPGNQKSEIMTFCGFVATYFEKLIGVFSIAEYPISSANLKKQNLMLSLPGGRHFSSRKENVSASALIMDRE